MLCLPYRLKITANKPKEKRLTTMTTATATKTSKPSKKATPAAKKTTKVVTTKAKRSQTVEEIEFSVPSAKTFFMPSDVAEFFQKTFPVFNALGFDCQQFVEYCGSITTAHKRLCALVSAFEAYRQVLVGEAKSLHGLEYFAEAKSNSHVVVSQSVCEDEVLVANADGAKTLGLKKLHWFVWYRTNANSITPLVPLMEYGTGKIRFVVPENIGVN
jgi:hypothetical protein